MAKKKIEFKAHLTKELQDPEFAANYLNEHMSYKGKLSKELLLEALMKIIEAYGITEVAKKSSLGRRTLYTALAKDGNPRFDTLLSILDHAGLSIKFAAKKSS